jgi:D-beta-D-heptose 7-phosphate kinase/D-beta-D-heptose 1-phosphate adenosyltransferase
MKNKVLVIGDVMLDEYWYGNSNRISPEAPVPIVNFDKKDFRLGGAANVAANIRSLGGNVTLLSLIGYDEKSKIFKELIDSNYIKQIAIKSKNLKITTKLRIISSNQQITRIDFDSETSSYSKLIFNRLKKIFHEFDFFVFSDYNKGALTNIKLMIDFLVKNNKSNILVDPKKKDLICYSNSFIMTPNKKEFLNYINVTNFDDRAIELGFECIKKLKLKYLLITLGENGMMLLGQNKKTLFKANADEVYDVSGAGDTVIASLAFCLSNSISIANAVKFSNMTAGIVVGRQGTSIINKKDIKKMRNFL